MFRKRGPEEALGFGYGDHRCIAEMLARAELETVFCKQRFIELVLWFGNLRVDTFVATLFQTLPSLKLAVPKSEIQWTPPTRDVGIVGLPVTWDRDWDEEGNVRFQIDFWRTRRICIPNCKLRNIEMFIWRVQHLTFHSEFTRNRLASRSVINVWKNVANSQINIV